MSYIFFFIHCTLINQHCFIFILSVELDSLPKITYKKRKFTLSVDKNCGVGINYQDPKILILIKYDKFPLWVYL